MHTVGGGVEFVPRYRVHTGIIAGRRVHVASFYIAHLRGVDQRDSRWCSTTALTGSRNPAEGVMAPVHMGSECNSIYA